MLMSRERERDYEGRNSVQDILGRTVRVWFSDKGKNYKGVVSKRVSGNDYIVKWVDKREGEETVSLSPLNCTKDARNQERWSVVKRVK